MRSKYCSNVFFLCLLFFIASSCDAQKLRLNGYGSYVLDGTYNIFYSNTGFYEGKIDHGMQVGLGAEYMVTPNYGIELSYLTRKTDVLPQRTLSYNLANTSLRFHYMMVGLNAYPQIRAQKLEPFGGVSAGVITQTATDREATDMSNKTIRHSVTKFAWAAKLGGIFWLSNRVGLKSQVQWVSALQFENGKVNFTVHPSGIGRVEYSIANQFEVGSGFIIKLGRPGCKS